MKRTRACLFGVGLVVAVACGGGDSLPRVCAGAVADDSLDVDELCTEDAQCRWPVCHQGYCAAQCDKETKDDDFSFECRGDGVMGTCKAREVDGMPLLGCAYYCAKDADCPVLADATLRCVDGLCEAPSCEELGG